MKVFYGNNYIAKNTVNPAWMLESSHKDVKQCFEVIIYNHVLTIRGTGFWHPCQNDGYLA
jgi:hypothetical protein